MKNLIIATSSVMLILIIIFIAQRNETTEVKETYSYSHIYGLEPVESITSKREIGFPVAAYSLEHVWNDCFIFGGNALRCVGAENGKVRWELKPQGRYAKNVTQNDGVLYFASEDTFYAVNTADGKNLWKTEVADGAYADKPVVTDNYVCFVTETGGLLYSLDRKTGKQVWSYRLPEELQQPPLPFGDLVLLLLKDCVQALDAAGKPVWRVDFTFGKPEWGRIVKGRACLLSSGAEMCAVDKTGRIDFSIDKIKTPPAVFDNILCYARTDQSIEAYDITAKQVLWNKKLSEGLADGPVLQTGHTSFFVSVDGRITAVDVTSGIERWSYSTGENLKDFMAAKSEARLFVVANNSLIALNLTGGQKLWSAKIAPVADFTASENAIVLRLIGKSLQVYGAANGKLLWQQNDPRRSISRPLIGNGKVVFRATADNAIHCKDIKHGTEKWMLRNAAGEMKYSPAIWKARNSVVAGYPNGLIRVFPAASHMLPNSFTISDNSITCGPCADGESLYIASSGGKLTCDARGKTLWTYTADGDIASPPVVTEKSIYFGDLSGSLHKLDKNAGKEIWSSYTGSAIRTSTAIVGDRVFAGNDSGKAFAFDPEGKRIWEMHINAAISSSPTSDGSSVFIGDKNGTFYALDPKDGKILWQFQADGAISLSSACSRGCIYFGTTGGTMYALDSTTGKCIWSRKQGGFASEPALAGNMLYYGCDDGNLYALDADTGTVKWSFKTGAPVVTAPAIYNRSIYLGSTDGFLYLIK